GAHSLTIDQAGRVWFTEEETGKLGFLDPATAQPGTSAGITEIPLGLTAFNTPIAPADLTVAGDGTIFWVDEYGDVVGSATVTERVHRGGPAGRASNTDSPVVDGDGTLWFTEAGDALLTRIGGVGAPTSPAVNIAPAITADLATGAVTGS